MRKAQYWLERKIQNLPKDTWRKIKRLKVRNVFEQKVVKLVVRFYGVWGFCMQRNHIIILLLPCTTVLPKQLSTDIWYLHISFNIWDCVVGSLDNITEQKLCIQCSDSNTGRCKSTLRLINCVPSIDKGLQMFLRTTTHFCGFYICNKILFEA